MSKHFWFGFFAALGWTAGIQDTYGLEGYIESLRGHWIPFSPWVGFGICVVSVIGSMYTRKRKA